MTPLAIRTAAEKIAVEAGTQSEARLRGADLGEALAARIRARGLTARLADGSAVIDFELVLLQLASTRDSLVADVATGALHALRQERERARREIVPGQALSSSQCAQARKLLGWSQRELADRSGINSDYVGTFERTGEMPRRVDRRHSRLWAIRTALEGAGVEFIDDNGGGAGVRLRKSDPP